MTSHTIRAALVDASIDPAAMLAEVMSPARGAAALFVGAVRDTHGGRPVTGLEYSAYDAMAEAELTRIAVEAAERFGDAAIAVEHRTGTLDVGDVSVCIAAAHARRANAMDAMRYVIEEIKKRVPVWKLEHYADGTREWVNAATGNRQPATGTTR